MELYKEIAHVDSKEEFIKFIGHLVNDFKENRVEWENKTLDTYLEGMQSWVDDMEGYFKNNNMQTPKNINWNFFANVLYAAKIYE